MYFGAITKGDTMMSMLDDPDLFEQSVAGILLITIASGISYTAFRLFLDMKSGIFERF